MKIRTIILAFLLITFLSSCARENLMNIDTFIAYWNKVSNLTLEKENFISYIQKDKVIYSTETGDINLSVICDKNSLKIIQVSLCSDKKLNDDFSETAESLISAILHTDENKSDEIISQLQEDETKSDNNFQKSYIFEKDVTIGLISADAGVRFYINFNELNNIVSTQLPEFQENYTYSSNDG